MMAGWIVGPGILDIAGTSKSGTGIIEGHHPKPGVAPENIPQGRSYAWRTFGAKRRTCFA